MFQELSNGVTKPDWADDRYYRLLLHDLWLEGKFYDHLRYSFYDETEGDRYIPIKERRPSVQFNLPNHISTSIARKLFGGRHTPRFTHESDAMVAQVNYIVEQSKFWDVMNQAAFYGSVGSVAVTFKVAANGRTPGNRLVFSVWRARECFPIFDSMGELQRLRIARPTMGCELKRMGYPPPIIDRKEGTRGEYEPQALYWFIRDFTPEAEMTFVPIVCSEWSPCFDDDQGVIPIADKTVLHNLNFVPAQWITNLSGGCYPDGASTWGVALNTCIEIDYTMSQLGRGIRYTAAPQLVLVGQISNWDFSDPAGMKIAKSPAHAIQFPPVVKDAMGNQSGGGEAKLLETSGQGIAAGLSYYEHVRKIALEQIAASRKDPDKFRVPQSGKAMTVLDEDFHDLVTEQRTNYGDYGALPMLHKALIVAEKARLYRVTDANKLHLQWPHMYEPSPGDIQSLAQGLQILVGSPENGGIAILDRDAAQRLLEAFIDIPPQPQRPQPLYYDLLKDEETDLPEAAHYTNGSAPQGGDALDAVNAPQGQTLA